MKLKFGLWVFLLSITSLVLATDDLPDAPKEVIESALSVCKQDAVIEEIAASEMKQFLLECVNDELVAQGYKKLEKIEQ